MRNVGRNTWDADPSTALRALRMTSERTVRRRKGPSGTPVPTVGGSGIGTWAERTVREAGPYIPNSPFLIPNSPFLIPNSPFLIPHSPRISQKVWPLRTERRAAAFLYLSASYRQDAAPLIPSVNEKRFKTPDSQVKNSKDTANFHLSGKNILYPPVCICIIVRMKTQNQSRSVIHEKNLHTVC